MKNFARGLSLAALMALVLGVVAATGAARAFEDDDAAIKNAQKDIHALADEIAAGKNVSAKAAALKKKYEELNTVMHAYKPSTKKGIGVGAKGPGDGIELKIINLGKRALTGGALAKEKADLIKMGYINAAIAEITLAYSPTTAKGSKTPKAWKQHSEEMKKASLELVEAVKAGNTDKIKAAANNLNNSCNECHSIFRDS